MVLAVTGGGYAAWRLAQGNAGAPLPAPVVVSIPATAPSPSAAPGSGATASPRAPVVAPVKEAVAAVNAGSAIRSAPRGRATASAVDTATEPANDASTCSSPPACIVACEEQRVAKACLTVADLYSTGSRRLPANPDRAAKYARKACELGSAEGCRRAPRHEDADRSAPAPGPSPSAAAACGVTCRTASAQCEEAAVTEFAECSSGCGRILSRAQDCMKSCSDDHDDSTRRCRDAKKGCEQNCSR